MSVLEYYTPPQEPLNIIHQDDDVLVLSKPSGLLSVPGKGDHLQDSLELRAKKDFPQALLVHRLDMDTSGLMVMGMNPRAQKHLGMQFEKRYVTKIYVARVYGMIVGESGQVDLPLICDWPNRPLQKVCYDTGKPAQTNWEVLERNEESYSTLVKLMPKTGRSHQLRVHMQKIGYPILGDEFYATGDALIAAPRLMLHAQELKLRHPATHEDMVFKDVLSGF